MESTSSRRGTAFRRSRSGLPQAEPEKFLPSGDGEHVTELVGLSIRDRIATVQFQAAGELLSK